MYLHHGSTKTYKRKTGSSGRALRSSFEGVPDPAMPASTKNEKPAATGVDEEEDNKPIAVLDEADIALLKTYGLGPYTTRIKTMEKDLKALAKNVNTLCGMYMTPTETKGFLCFVFFEMSDERSDMNERTRPRGDA